MIVDNNSREQRLQNGLCPHCGTRLYKTTSRGIGVMENIALKKKNGINDSNNILAPEKCMSPLTIPGSRFELNVTAGSQKRAIANLRESEGRDESRFALKIKRNLDFNCKSRSLSILCLYLDESCYYWDNQFVWAFSRCVENDSL